MTETVDVPKVGAVDKRVVGAIAVSAAGFIGYRYWSAKKSPATDDTDGGYETPSEFDDSSGSPSAVLGAVRPNNDYGIADPSIPEPASTDDFGFHGKTNDAWTQYAAVQLSQSDRWSYADVVEALGKYLGQKPTTAAQQSIITSAIAVAGYPPIGTFTLIHAPDPIVPVTPPVTPTPVTPAPGVPTGLKAVKITTTSINVAWNKVTGAHTYDVDIVPGGSQSSTSLDETFTGLKSKTSYQFRVRAVASNGLNGSWSPYLTVKTK